MDTDFLSNETYNGVLMEAEKFNHDLHFNLQFWHLIVKTRKSIWKRPLCSFLTFELLTRTNCTMFFRNPSRP